MAPHSSTLTWKIPWMEEPGGLQSMGSRRVGHDERLHFHFSLWCIGEGNGNPLQCSCLENPRDGEPGGLPSMGSHRVGHDWSDLATAAYHIYYTWLSLWFVDLTPWEDRCLWRKGLWSTCVHTKLYIYNVYVYIYIYNYFPCPLHLAYCLVHSKDLIKIVKWTLTQLATGHYIDPKGYITQGPGGNRGALGWNFDEYLEMGLFTKYR